MAGKTEVVYDLEVLEKARKKKFLDYAGVHELLKRQGVEIHVQTVRRAFHGDTQKPETMGTIARVLGLRPEDVVKVVTIKEDKGGGNGKRGKKSAGTRRTGRKRPAAKRGKDR